jgi:hypothetical protein
LDARQSLYREEKTVTTKKRTAIPLNEDESESDTEARSGEQSRDAFDLRDEICKKLSQADGICTVICSMSDMANTPVSASLWAASELIDDAKEAVDKLYEQASRSAEKGVQP